MKAPAIKAAAHGALAVASVVEYLHADTGLRKFLLGLAAGWHLQSVAYHVFLEEEEVCPQFKKQLRPAAKGYRP